MGDDFLILKEFLVFMVFSHLGIKVFKINVWTLIFNGRTPARLLS